MKTIFKHFSIILTSLMLCTSISINALQQSKVRTAGNFALAALKKGAGAMKANPYTAAAAVTAIAAGKYVHYRYNYHENYANKVRRAAQIRPAMQQLDYIIPDTLTIELASGDIENFKLEDREHYTNLSFRGLIHTQAADYNYCIIARVVAEPQEGGAPGGPAEARTYYFDAFSFNGAFFDDNNNEEAWWLNYRIPGTQLRIDRNIGVEYFIYDYNQPEKGFEYFCTFGRQQVEGAEQQGNSQLYNAKQGTTHYNFTPDKLNDVFYAHLPHNALPLSLLRKKIRIKKRLNYAHGSGEAQMIAYHEQTAKAMQAEEAAERASRITLGNVQPQENVLFGFGVVSFALSATFALTAVAMPPAVMLTHLTHALFGTIQRAPVLNWSNLLVPNKLQCETITLHNWREAALYSDKACKLFAKPAGYLGALCIGSLLIWHIQQTLAARDAAAQEPQPQG